MPNEYRPRIVDSFLEKRLSSAGAILIEGSKGCGKTTTGKKFCKSFVQISDARNPGMLEIARTSPADVLEGECPRLLDEWQFAPGLWDAVRAVVDERGKTGQFILTGSSVPREDGYLHSGVSRISRVTMRPMSLFESGESNGKISLKALFDGTAKGIAVSDMTLKAVSDMIVRGGWPMAVNNNIIDGTYAIDYIDGVVNSEISRIDDVKRDPVAVRRVLLSLARNTSTMAAVTTIMKDAGGQDGSVSDKSVRTYLNILSRLFVTEDVPAWNPSMRSATAVRSSAKRQFTDPSLAAALLGTDSGRLMGDLETMGFLFESLCDRDLRIYSQPIGGTLNHYRDSNNLETDAVVHLNDGRWGAIEVKLGVSGIESGVSNLLKLKRNIDTTRMGEPSFLMVLTSTGTAHRREDGIWVVPIGCLGP